MAKIVTDRPIAFRYVGRHVEITNDGTITKVFIDGKEQLDVYRIDIKIIPREAPVITMVILDVLEFLHVVT
jgi:hypothetical protein